MGSFVEFIPVIVLLCIIFGALYVLFTILIRSQLNQVVDKNAPPEVQEKQEQEIINDIMAAYSRTNMLSPWAG